jgi:hypothetical protein
VSAQTLKQILEAQLDRASTLMTDGEALGVEDVERATTAVKGVVGKRLTYKQPHSPQGQDIPF